jgi:hypothetical protein
MEVTEISTRGSVMEVSLVMGEMLVIGIVVATNSEAIVVVAGLTTTEIDIAATPRVIIGLIRIIVDLMLMRVVSNQL